MEAERLMETAERRAIDSQSYLANNRTAFYDGPAVS